MRSYPPRAIFLGHIDDPIIEFLVDAESSSGLSGIGAIEFLGGQLSVPCQDRIGFDDICHLSQGLFSKFLTDLCQDLALSITELNAALDLVAQDAIFFDQVFISQPKLFVYRFLSSDPDLEPAMASKKQDAQRRQSQFVVKYPEAV